MDSFLDFVSASPISIRFLFVRVCLIKHLNRFPGILFAWNCEKVRIRIFMYILCSQLRR